MQYTALVRWEPSKNRHEKLIFSNHVNISSVMSIVNCVVFIELTVFFSST